MIIDLAKERADAMAKANGSPVGAFRIAAVVNGNVAIECVDNGVVLWRRDITIAQAREMQGQLGFACMCAKQAFQKWHGIVWLAWCKPTGDQVRADIVHNHVRARILEGADTAVLIEIAPEPGRPEQPEGWPKKGWYTRTGWPVKHERNRRCWRIIDGVQRQKKDGAK